MVARSAPMLFSSCPIDLTPLADLGSVSISRSFRLRRQSRIAFQGMIPRTDFKMGGCRPNNGNRAGVPRERIKFT